MADGCDEKGDSHFQGFELRYFLRRRAAHIGMELAGSLFCFHYHLGWCIWKVFSSSCSKGSREIKVELLRLRRKTWKRKTGRWERMTFKWHFRGMLKLSHALDFFFFELHLSLRFASSALLWCDVFCSLPALSIFKSVGKTDELTWVWRCSFAENLSRLSFAGVFIWYRVFFKKVLHKRE